MSEQDETQRLTEENRRLKNECDNLRVAPWFVYICTFCDWTSGLVRTGAKTAHDCPAIAAERDACAKVAEDFYAGSEPYHAVEKGHASVDIAAAIRARGNGHV